MQGLVDWIRREPLAHFLMAGGVLFALFVVVGPESDPLREEVVITHAQQKNLAALFERTWNRPPTEQELEGLIQSHIREEILSREAVSLGLNDGDAVVRKRLAQKLEFLSDDLAAQLEPTDKELQAHLDNNADAYKTDARYSLEQVFIAPGRSAEDTEKEIASLLASLKTGEESQSLGDPTLLPFQMYASTTAQIAATYGQSFSEAIEQLPVGDWHKNVLSSFGHHIVRVTQKEDSDLPLLTDIRELVERDWRDAQRLKLRDAFYDDVRQSYDVTIEASTAPEMP